MIFALYYQDSIHRFALQGSYPGNPTTNPLKRRGHWPEKSTKLSSGWNFACDKESHDVTERAIPNEYPMTGESAGRQIWYKSESGDATADSTFDFSAHVNPNSGDKLFRDIMMKKWSGPVPDESTKPSSAKEAAAKALSFYQMIQCEDGHWAGVSDVSFVSIF